MIDLSWAVLVGEMIIVDTSGLIALFSESGGSREAVMGWLGE
ncbi:MAG: hypothetical protein OXI96_08800 [Acidimicrobiaceae bacterium]|nr:hypothetical protein [Acidimicrobiaceae bacterium]